PEKPVPDRGIKTKVFAFVEMMKIMKPGRPYSQPVELCRKKLSVQVSYCYPDQINRQIYYDGCQRKIIAH
ncbi:hypothetical protein NY412_18715, partial [Enterobacter hormaechei]